MSYLEQGAFTLLGVALSAGIALANCDTDDPDGSKVAAARQQVATDCSCDTSETPAVNHGGFVSCAAGVANDRAALDPADPNYLPKTCKGAVKKCAAKSVCGKPGFVTCCRDNGEGGIKCGPSKSATACSDKGGVPGLCTSCCDACGTNPAGASCPTPTTTLAPPTTTVPPPTTTVP